jgi:hypothetical protein
MRILIVFLMTLSLISGCATRTIHADIRVVDKPELPSFDRAQLDCKKMRDVCRLIVKRETLLKDHIETLEQLIQIHNEGSKQ